MFFKGCALRCSWCHNPENLSFEKELLHDYEKCIRCGQCVEICPEEALIMENKTIEIDRAKCNGCGLCAEYCIASAMEVAGQEYSVDDVIKEVAKDTIFYNASGGGVTLSGGECMVQDIDYLESLCKKFKRQGFHIAVDTSGHAPSKNYRRLLPYVDIFLFDIKIMDSAKHEKYVGQDNSLILSNLKLLNEEEADINIRIPIIKGVNADREEIKAIISFLKDNNIRPVQVNLLPYHEIGSHKYSRLNLAYPHDDFQVPAKEKMEEFQEIFLQSGFSNVYIGG